MIRLFFTILFLVAFSGSAATQDLSSYEADAEQALQRLRAAMMAEMQKAMQIGAKEAISVCRHLAPEIEEKIEAETGWEIRRTGLKVRNPDNAPVGDERALMQSMELKAMAGQDPSMLRTIGIVERDGRKTVRFMQAVPTFDTCLACHGSNIDPAVISEIRALYPHDEAVDYMVGDIRGAFSLYKLFDPSTQPAKTAAATEWQEIAALELPDEVTLTNKRTGMPASGRNAFARACKSCHSAGDLADHYYGPGKIPADAQVCLKLQTHGLTDEKSDCDIVAFLKVLADKR